MEVKGVRNTVFCHRMWYVTAYDVCYCTLRLRPSNENWKKKKLVLSQKSTFSVHTHTHTLFFIANDSIQFMRVSVFFLRSVLLPKSNHQNQINLGGKCYQICCQRSKMFIVHVFMTFAKGGWSSEMVWHKWFACNFNYMLLTRTIACDSKCELKIWQPNWIVAEHINIYKNFASWKV